MNDGFSFQNYTNQQDPVNLTGAELHRMFGDAVCARGNGPDCQLTPQAEQWRQQASDTMNGGHCEGMAVLSLRFFLGSSDPQDFGGLNTWMLQLDGNEALQRELGYWFTLQLVPPVATSRMPGSGIDILERFEASLDGGEAYTLAIWKRDWTGGHAITPYDVVENDDGSLGIMVYDNNFPGEARQIRVDPETGAWSYSAAANPDDPASLYEGDGTTNTLALVPMSVREGPRQCPFCGTYQAGMPGTRTVSVTGDASLLLEDADGNRLGHLPDGSFVSEMDGGSFIAPTSDDLFRDRAEPQYLVPSGSDIRVSIGDGGAGGSDESDFGILGPGYYLGVENIFLEPGQVDTATLGQDRAAITYETEGAETPDIVLAAETDAADWLVVVRSRGDSAGQYVSAELDFADGGVLNLEFGGSDPESEFDLYLTRIDDDGELEFGHENVVVPNGAALTLFFADFDVDGEELSVGVDMDHDGTPDTTIAVGDEGDAIGGGPRPGGSMSMSGGGCSVGGARAPLAVPSGLAGLAGLALVLRRRRRR